MVPYSESVSVFCGSSPGRKPHYMAAAHSVGRAIATQQWRLVYGGGSRGCMGGVSQAVIESDGHVLGVIPEVMTSAPTGHSGDPDGKSGFVVSKEGTGPTALKLNQSAGNIETVVVQSTHERKHRMASESTLGFIGLPGGYGTFEEILEMVTWNQLGIHNKPMVLLNLDGFFSALRQQIEIGLEEGFIPDSGRDLIRFVDCSLDDVEKAGQLVVEEVVKMREALVKRSGGYWNWTQSSANESSLTTSNETKMEIDDQPLAVEVPNLTFSFTPQMPPALQNCNLNLKRGSRCLLIGANGAGKSTLLRLLAGKRLCDSKVRVFGKDVFRDSPSGITYLGTEWAMNPVVRSDIVVSHFLDSVGGYRHKERRDRLLDILDVDLNWHMHAISDGERRRVQLCMGLMEPWDLLLLDEVTVDLDVQVRSDLLEFLKNETEERNATIIYATHIFDGLQSFPTHLVHMRLGTVTTQDPIAWPVSDLSSLIPPRSQTNAKTWSIEHDLSPLLNVSLLWLREDRLLRQQDEAKRGRRRGADRKETTDSQTFFSKYDYSQNVSR